MNDELTLSAVELSVDETAAGCEHYDEISMELLEVSEGIDDLLQYGESVPSLESSAASVAYNAHRTRLGLERVSPKDFEWGDVVEFFKKVWDAFKKAVRKGIDLIKRLISKLFTGFESVEKKSKNLRKSLKNTKDNDDAGFIKIQALTSLNYKGEISHSGFEQGMKSTLVVGKGLKDEYLSSAKNYYDRFDTFVNALQSMKNDDIEKSAGGLSERSRMMDDLHGPRSVTENRILGDYQFEAGEKTSSKAQKSQDKLGVDIHIPNVPSLKSVGESEQITAKEMGALSVSQMNNALDGIDDLSKLSLELNDAADKVIEAREELLKRVDKLLSKSSRSGNLSAQDLTLYKRYIRVAMNGIQKSILKPVSQYGQRSFKITRNLLVIVERSIREQNAV